MLGIIASRIVWKRQEHKAEPRDVQTEDDLPGPSVGDLGGLRCRVTQTEPVAR